jgi:hypothetical protein
MRPHRGSKLNFHNPFASYKTPLQKNSHHHFASYYDLIWQWSGDTDSSLANNSKKTDTKRHEDNSRRTPGLDPAGTATDLRRILETGGDGSEILAQHAALRQWAAEQDRILDADTWVAPSRLGGLEHRIWQDQTTGRVIKITYGGAFGRIARLTRNGLSLQPASPLAYLDRWARHNLLFGAITEVLGIVEARGGPQMVIAQRALRGSTPTQATVIAWLHARSYEPVEGLRHVYTSPVEGMALFDARPANFVQIQDTPVPFDLIPMQLQEVGLF